MVSVLTLIQGSAIVQMDILESIATLVGPIYQDAFMLLLVKCIGKIKKINGNYYISFTIGIAPVKGICSGKMQFQMYTTNVNKMYM